MLKIGNTIYTLDQWQRDMRSFATSLRRGLFKDRWLCVEGFPRSANSFVTNASRLLLGDEKGRIISHTHNREIVRHAIRKQIPTAITIRNPIDSVASLMIYHRQNDIEFGKKSLTWWIYFYRWFLKNKNLAFEFAFFEDITGNFNSFLEAMNDKFSMGFPKVENLEEFQARIRERLQKKFNKRARDLAQFSLPHSKKPLKTESKEKFKYLPITGDALDLYREIVSIFKKT